MNFIQFPSIFETYTSAPSDEQSGGLIGPIQTWDEYLKRANILYENPFLSI